MSDKLSAQIKDHFASLSDPRRRKVTYPLINLVTIALCAAIAGADDFVTIAAWARQKRAWLARFLDMTSGIPSHDRFNAIFKAIKPAEFERCLLSWVTSLHEVTAGRLVAIDGKTLRACAAIRGGHRQLVAGRELVARAGRGPGPLAAHATQVAEKGLGALPPGRGAGWPVGDLGGRG